MNSRIEQAGCWFLHSGIQAPEGGVARFYRVDQAANAPISYEITGYAASALAYLHASTGRPEYRDAAVRAARALARDAWDPAASAFPYEPGSDRAYFFDTGIIVRGLMAAFRLTGEEGFRDRARDGALALAFDFMGQGEFHPVIALPHKQALPYDPASWSRSPGCYQLKSALAWLEMRDEHATRVFDAALKFALATHGSFLDESRPGRMDRLHAYGYFLEALLFVVDRPQTAAPLAEGLAHASALFRELAPAFERSDVPAQLLRVRLIAHHLGVLPLDEAAAREEADRVAAFQIAPAEPDPRLRGAFYFGRRGGAMLPFANPVSTAFSLQALELWRQHQEASWRFELQQLI